MAIGLGRMLGFDFPKNFDFPYISKSITEFWRRWHMTLGSWFREYLYFPLGGSRRGPARTYFNLFVVWAAMPASGTGQLEFHPLGAVFLCPLGD